MEITVALAQMGIALGQPEQNAATAQTLAAQAAAQGADLLLLPELIRQLIVPAQTVLL